MANDAEKKKKNKAYQINCVINQPNHFWRFEWKNKKEKKKKLISRINKIFNERHLNRNFFLMRLVLIEKIFLFNLHENIDYSN